MISVLDSLASGLVPDSSRCPECRLTSARRCPGCAAALTDSRRVNSAIAAVDSARTDAEALAAYQLCLLDLI